MAGEPVDPQDQVIDIPNNFKARVKFIKQEVLRAVSPLCVESRKANKGLPDPTTEPTKTLLPRLEQFLRWLETSVEITPALAEDSKIANSLKLMFDDPRFQFEQQTAERARQLYERWEDEKWGEGEVVEESTDDESGGDDTAPDVKRKKSSASATGTDLVPTTRRAPPASHPIFGVHGIMHGVIRTSGRRKNYKLDPRYTKRPFKVYGDNRIAVGQWWPMQIIARFHGAHGHPVAGISGNSETGAYSVVISGGQYEELDEDRGDTLYYSGSDSHDNTDPKKAADSSTGTLALKASLRTQRPVRVLRAAGFGGKRGGSSWRPTVGIRYDGRYRVDKMILKTNNKGGLYEQFKLVRLPGQPAIDRVSRPTAAEKRDFAMRDYGY